MKEYSIDKSKQFDARVETCCKQLRNSGVREEICSIRVDLGHGGASQEPNNSPSHKLVTPFRGMARITWQVGPVVNDRGWLDSTESPVRECWWQRIPRSPLSLSLSLCKVNEANFRMNTKVGRPVDRPFIFKERSPVAADRAIMDLTHALTLSPQGWWPWLRLRLSRG